MTHALSSVLGTGVWEGPLSRTGFACIFWSPVLFCFHFGNSLHIYSFLVFGPPGSGVWVLLLWGRGSRGLQPAQFAAVLEALSPVEKPTGVSGFTKFCCTCHIGANAVALASIHSVGCVSLMGRRAAWMPAHGHRDVVAPQPLTCRPDMSVLCLLARCDLFRVCSLALPSHTWQKVLEVSVLQWGVCADEP